MNKFNVISSVIVILLLTNYFGWTIIPWILIQIPATIIAAIWAWAIVVGTIIFIKNNTK